METPLVLVDLDGVLNAFDAYHPLQPHMRYAKASKYTVILDKRHPEWLAALEARADIRWATMWQSDAAIHFAPVAGYGHTWPHIDFDRHHKELGWRTGAGVVGYKWPGILEATGADQPLVYIDDDMDRIHHEWAARRNARGIPTLFIQPDPRYGFTRRQYETVIAFLDTVAPVSVAA